MRANDRSLKNLKKGSELVAVNKKNGKKRKAGMSTFKKGDKEVKKGASRAVRAQALLDDYGLCPISMQPMRRPVLPSSGQAYDEISLQRCSPFADRLISLILSRSKVSTQCCKAARQVIRHASISCFKITDS